MNLHGINYSELKGAERIEAMKYLRHIQNMTTPEIGRLFRITRERVRQLIGNTGRGFATRHKKKIWNDNKGKTNAELKELLGLSSDSSLSRYRQDEWHEANGENSEKNGFAQRFVSDHLAANGFENKLLQQKWHRYIFLDNGLKIHVVASNPLDLHGTPAKTYNFNTRGIACDFYACLCLDTLDVFIIPSFKVRDTGAPIRFSFPSTHPYKSKWLQYHNRLDLLDKN